MQCIITHMQCIITHMLAHEQSMQQSLRVKNVDNILLGHVNINSLRNKSEMLADLIKGKLDIMLISETKNDHSFPTSQFDIEGYTSFRLDRTANGGGILLHTRYDIPAKKLPILGTENIECTILEITITKKKWLLLKTYNPNISLITKHQSVLSKCICHYAPSYHNIFLFGDFNCEVSNDFMLEICNRFNLTSLIKENTCFKSVQNPSCIDLILTNRPNSIQNSMVIETGLSDFHKLTATVLKTYFWKMPPKVV